MNHLPSPSIWPFVLGSGVALLAFGLVTTWLFYIVGSVVCVMGLAGWIGELRRE